jgi:hypothetical protein
VARGALRVIRQREEVKIMQRDRRKKFFSRIQRVIRYGHEMNHCNCRSETAPLRSFEKSARQHSRDIFSRRKNIKFPHFSFLSSRGGGGSGGGRGENLPGRQSSLSLTAVAENYEM